MDPVDPDPQHLSWDELGGTLVRTTAKRSGHLCCIINMSCLLPTATRRQMHKVLTVVTASCGGMTVIFFHFLNIIKTHVAHVRSIQNRKARVEFLNLGDTEPQLN